MISTSWTQILSIDLKYQTLDVWFSNGDLAPGYPEMCCYFITAQRILKSSLDAFVQRPYHVELRLTFTETSENNSVNLSGSWLSSSLL